LGVLAAFIAVATPVVVVVHAAEEHASEANHEAGAHHEAGHHAPGLGDLLFPAINFSIYLAIVVRFVIPAMREYLRRRRADIAQVATESSAALASAEQAVNASKARLASLKTEADGIRQDLVAIAERQAQRLIAEAEDTGSRRLADASLVAEQERRRAGAEIRADIARAASALAEQKIRGVLTPDDQGTFVRQFLKDAATT
jgi:F0F1-type ATP synthase membrane subunit b/b'